MRDSHKALWPTLSPLLDQALDLDPGARSELVAAIRRSAPEVGAALEQLLIEHDRVRASTFLETPAVADGILASLAGQTIGAYTLVRPLGIGGMGTVWLARRSDGRFEGNVAVKLVNLAVLDREGQERFRREGTFLARLAHPHIARLFDAGVTLAGQPFLVLEYVEGSRIDRYAADRLLGVEARLELFLQVADAIAHAHANLVVHRDLKPSNVLVDKDGRVKLLDFGIATLVDPGSEGVAMTLTGGRALTPEHAAPEQAIGGTITTATDVYALGVLLYELLVGLHPTAPKGATQAEILRALAELEPLRPSDAIGRIPAGVDAARIFDERGTTRDRLRRACRGDLDTILLKALKKNPAERYQTVTALAEDLRRHLRKEPVAARPDSAWYRTRKFAARHRLEIGAAAAIALALIVGSGIAVRQAQVSTRERDHALEQLRRAEITNDFSSFLLSEATPPGRPLTNADMLSRGEQLIDRRFAGDAVLRVHMLLMLSERYYENFQFDRWRASVAHAFEQSQTMGDVPLRAVATCTMAIATAERGDFARAGALITEGLAQLATQDDVAAEAAKCRLAESVTANMQGDGVRAVRAGEEAVRLEQTRRGPPGRDFEALAALANAYGTAGRFASADRTYQAAMDVLEAQGRGTTRNAATFLNNWGVSMQAAGQHLHAVPLSERAVAMSRQLDSERGAPPSQLWTLANALSFVGRHDEAVATVDEAVSKARTAGSPISLFWALGAAGRAYGEGGRLDESDARLREMEALVAAQPNLPVPVHGAMARFVAQGALRRNHPDAAVTLARRALERLEAARRPPRDVLPVLLVLASALNGAAQFETARATAERAREMARDRLGEFKHSYDLGLAHLELGIAQAGLKHPDVARGWLRSALADLQATAGENAPAAQRAAEQLAQLGE